jgi:ABC-type Fe3+/spermidine/putrescine transport system ATPase subunit
MSLQINDIRVSYGKTRALDGVTVKLEPGEMFFLLGPSGCGKSTLLRSVAGFIEDFEGDIQIDGASLKGVPAHRRDFGMVFQNYALFPHLTVNGNVAFGLEARGVQGAEKQERVAEALRMVGLAGYGERRPGELSGGQQQRVALARALVIRPRVLLLDEPLSNLDAKLRWEMREEIRRIHRKTKITTLYVTHDQKEALSLADRMAIMKAGKIDALGPPRDLYRHPPTRFSAEFLGDINALPAKLSADKAVAATPLGPAQLKPAAVPQTVPAGADATVFCRSESVRVAPAESAEEFPPDYVPLTATARVISSSFSGENTLYDIEFNNDIRWRVIRHDAVGEGLPDGTTVKAAVHRQGWSVVPLEK